MAESQKHNFRALTDILQIVGNRARMEWPGIWQTSAQLLSYCLTAVTHLNNDECKSSHEAAVKFSALERLLSILNSTDAGQRIFLLLMQRLEDDLTHPILTKMLHPEVRSKLLYIIPILHQVVSVFTLSKQMTGVCSAIQIVRLQSKL